ncbi:MAG TPA: YqjK-like family protein, partial [Gallionella sp.]|nr:YqjK-like family protein [Gallionella sp.]
MNKQMLEVMQRRGELLARIASQREQVAEIGARWQAPLTLADQGLAAMRFLRSNPVLVAGVAALF